MRVGRGVAERMRAMGCKVIVTETDPIKALEAHMDGYDLMPMIKAAALGQIFITCTGGSKIITTKHMRLMREGAILANAGHFNDKKHKNLKIDWCTEETTAGVTRIKAIEKKGKLRYPVIVVNDARTKNMFDNRYGTGQSAIDGYLRAMNLLFASKRVVVAGYGWVGRGVAQRCRGMGSKVILTEIDPVKALEAHMDGYDVMPMAKAAKIGDIFITCTGMRDIITKSHIGLMKDGAILGNVGHFDIEIDTEYLLKKSKSVREIRPNLDECLLSGKKRVYLIGKGRLANLVAAEGHPPEVMAQSFSNQMMSIMHILKNHKKLPRTLIKVPEDLDKQVAVDALKAMSVGIDKLTPKQIEYMHSW